MKMIPPFVVETTNSAAERRLFPILERTELDRHAVGLHSIDLPRHRYKRMGEIDYVILSRAGLLVCEVKGGIVDRDDDGRWRYTNRYGESDTRREGPFQQARSAMFSLKDDLEQRIDRGLLDQVSFGYCVITPDTSWGCDSVDAPRVLTLNSADLTGARELCVPLVRLLEHWQEGNRCGEMSAEALDRVRNAIRGRFDPIVSLGTRARGISTSLEELTEEQYMGLDWVESSERVLISGGAGTGKTLLAVEAARRESLAGRSVLLTCHSPVLAAFLSTRVAEGVAVEEFERARDLVDERGARFDALVVDEAQDIFSLEGIAALDDLVTGGVDHGRWRCFFDRNNQAGLFGIYDRDVHGLLKDTGAHEVVLTRNCRNTKAIVLQTQSVTGADLGTPLAGDGPEVSFAKPEDRQSEGRLLAAELERLAAADVAAGSITVLLGGAADDVLKALPAALRKRITHVPSSTALEWPCSRLTSFRIEDFKGLENDFILVCGLAGLDATQRDRAGMYVAMSRARIGLWVAIPASLADRFEELRRTNLTRILSSMEGLR